MAAITTPQGTTPTHWLVKGTSRRVFVVQGDRVQVKHWEHGIHARVETLDVQTARGRWAWLVRHGWEKW